MATHSPQDRHRAARLLAVLAVLSLGACSPSRMWEAGLVLDDIAAGEGDSRLKQVTYAPSREPVRYTVAGRERMADLYRPANAARAALVLVPGAAPQGKDDPRLIAFAQTLARARFVVLVPEIENLRDLQVAPSDAIAVADAVLHLAASGAGDASVGIVAISYAAGPAVLAAMDPAAGALVRFVLAVGGYYDIDAVVTFFTTGAYRAAVEDPWLYRTPNAYGKWVFAKANADRLESPSDRSLVAEMAERKMRDVDADIGDLAAKFGPEGRAIDALLTNRDPERVPALIAALPASVREAMAALDLERQDLRRLGARLILVHGRDDAIIPFTESEALARAAPAGRADLFVVDRLAHVELGAIGIVDGLTLWNAAYRLLSERDAMPVRPDSRN